MKGFFLKFKMRAHIYYKTYKGSAFLWFTIKETLFLIEEFHLNWFYDQSFHEFPGINHDWTINFIESNQNLLDIYF